LSTFINENVSPLTKIIKAKLHRCVSNICTRSETDEGVQFTGIDPASVKRVSNVQEHDKENRRSCVLQESLKEFL
jgi:hypothetical protein